MDEIIKVGDIVARKSYDLDTMFKIETIENGVAQLKGVFFRLSADSPVDDLEKVCEDSLCGALQEEEQVIREMVQPEMEGMRNLRIDGDFFISGRILHIDGDEDYLERSAKLYEHANVYATTLYVKEKLMPETVPQLVKQLRPNIVVITGHDAIENKDLAHTIEGYRSTRYFVNTVNELRKIEPSLQNLIIIAGACQSHFEAIIGSGANYASSPGRINIHALDPAIIAATVALTPYNDEVDLRKASEKTVSKIKGIGGLQTNGTLRYGIKK